MTKTTLLSPLLFALMLGVSGCNTVANVTHPGTIDENYAERTLGTKVEDESILTKIRHNLGRTDARLEDARINVDVFNRVVLLTGQVPSEELRDMAGTVARDVRNVREVHNELTVAANLPASQRLADTWLSARIKATLATREEIDSGRIEVITENASVYLMGIVTRAEADRIVEAVSQVGGMERIVKVFDYLD